MDGAYRSGLRGQLTKVVNLINEYLSKLTNSDEPIDEKMENLHTYLTRVENLQRSLSEADTIIRDSVREENAVAECSAVIDYRDKAITAIARIKYRIQTMHNTLTAPMDDSITRGNSGNDENNTAANVMNQVRGKVMTHINLPKLELRKFDGDLEKWIPFWEQFKVAVHWNANLDDASKFTYLQGALTGKAANTVAGMTPTESCYKEAIEMLKEEYGQPDRIIDNYMQKLMSIKPVKFRNDTAALRQLYTSVTAAIRSLSALNVSSSQYNIMLKSIIIRALPSNLKIQYFREASHNEKGEHGDESTSANAFETTTGTIDCDPMIRPLLRFLRVEVESLEKANATTTNLERSMGVKPRNNYATAAGLLSVAKDSNCFFCNSADHPTLHCEFPMTINEKKNKLKVAGRCFRCTSTNHMARYCKSKFIRCRRCKGNHASSMCDPNFAKKALVSCVEKPGIVESKSTNAVNLLSYDWDRIFLQTGCAIAMSEGREGRVRFILDTGSTRTYLRKDVADQLKCPIVNKVAMKIFPFGRSDKPIETVSDIVKINLKSQYSGKSLEMKAVVVPDICVDIFPAPDVKHPALCNLELADNIQANGMMVPGISLLIGSDYYHQSMLKEIKMLTPDLAAINTKFGWILHGPDPINMARSSGEEVTMLVHSLNRDKFHMENFWELEAIGITNNEKEEGINEFLTSFADKNIKWDGKRYTIGLPWRASSIKLDDNYVGAYSRFQSLIKRLAEDHVKLVEYDNAVWEFINNGIAEVADRRGSNERTFYLPHRAVYRQDKTSTQVRIVFDASAHGQNNPSLNNQLHQGPNMLPELTSILLSFRKGLIGLVADIEKAFLQISVNKEDRDALRFLWFSKPLTSPVTTFPSLQIYRFTRVIFGVNCSPFLLNAVLRKHLSESTGRFKETIQTHLYMDDLVVSLPSLEFAEALYYEAKHTLAGASMNLRKWNSNNECLRRLFQRKGDSSDSHLVQKVLGIKWNLISDVIQVDLKPVLSLIDRNLPPTKRNVLKIMATIFDPLGMLSPFILRIKLLLQDIWKIKPAWDDLLPHDVSSTWQKWCAEIPQLEELNIPRCVFTCESINQDDLQLHIFADASPRAYGAVAYVRSTYSNGAVAVNFLCSKTRVAPLKSDKGSALSLPKLELTAALISARMKSFITNSTSFKFSSTYCWTDSCITLCWINNEHKKWQPYISNRVEEIKSHSSGEEWKYVRSKGNPADLLTRGILAKQLVSNPMWLLGPNWLMEPQEKWPRKEAHIDSILVAVSLNANDDLSTAMEAPIFNLENTNSYIRLLRITSYIFRFIRNSRSPTERMTKALTAIELEQSRNYWIKSEQHRWFTKEMSCIRKGKQIERQSALWKLCPSLDDQGRLRLGGRLQEIEDELIAHPLILPKNSYLTLLIAKHAHSETHHAGPNVMLAYLRKNFWIPSGRQLVKKVINRCIMCQRLFGKSASQPFAPLPKDRLQGARSFEVTGMDFAGPLFVKADEEGAGMTKTYLLLFTCACIRAVHLELVKSLTTASCLNALRKFIARRGTPRIIYSDNAKTFKRADYEIQKLYQKLNASELTSFAAAKNIRWKFIVERAPWWGGWWERLIRTIKNSLKATIGRGKLSFEQLETLLVEIEAIVNSRPLTYVSSDPADLSPLCPNDFLLGKYTNVKGIFENDLELKHINKKDLNELWVSRQRLLKNFWNRWTSEYLHQLKIAHEFHPKNSSCLKVNDIVLVHEQNVPRLLWKLGKITTLFQGRDGRVRACEIQMPSGKLLRRAIQVIYPLEIHGDYKSLGGGC